MVGAPSLRQVPFDVADTARQARAMRQRPFHTLGKWLGQRACQRVGLCVVPALVVVPLCPASCPNSPPLACREREVLKAGITTKPDS
ncbi:unnamed protein product [Arctia plantaginis]|uniref:Uncharacterized protein n=1 Tax=Arctia plantaginis TaxID=874455 RepID=A0A8S1AJR6_ARCPL|nr:unnamed protein product [Arctia plantaginis]